MDDDQRIRITLRLPEGLHSQLATEADRASRSLNGEIIARLEESLQERAFQLPRSLEEAVSERAAAASTSFGVELARLLAAGLERRAPAVLIVELSNSVPLSKIAALIDAAREQLPPGTQVRFEPK